MKRNPFEVPLPPFYKDDRAECHRVSDPDVFFPPSYREGTAALDAARKVCEGCVLIVECGRWAVFTGEPEGVWGALTPKQRREFRRQLGLADAGTS